MEKTLNTKTLTERPRRTTLGERSRISIRDRDPNYHYRLVNCNLQADPDRVERFQDMGYEIVPRKENGRLGDAKVDNPSAIGSAGQLSVGLGDKAVWMRIPKDWYAEDQAAKQREIDESEKRTSQEGADYGKVVITSTAG
jgi:hypothetical protein